ncbi:MAG TPA: hypothetical protein VN181_10690 [Thermoanaerobaculia bacterium]|nr:hypothetical protein [Thermoanaerobaculia bacterium]
MISTALMLLVAAILAVTLVMSRQSRLRQRRIERENRAMQLELERHRATVHSILRELEQP